MSSTNKLEYFNQFKAKLKDEQPNQNISVNDENDIYTYSSSQPSIESNLSINSKPKFSIPEKPIKMCAHKHFSCLNGTCKHNCCREKLEMRTRSELQNAPITKLKVNSIDGNKQYNNEQKTMKQGKNKHIFENKINIFRLDKIYSNTMYY
jgi:hypothetical protein